MYINSRDRSELAKYEGQVVSFQTYLTPDVTADIDLGKRVINGKLHVCLENVDLSTLGGEHKREECIGTVDHMFVPYSLVVESGAAYSSVYGTARVRRYYRANGSKSYELAVVDMSDLNEEEARWAWYAEEGLRKDAARIAFQQFESTPEYQASEAAVDAKPPKSMEELEEELRQLEEMIANDIANDVDSRTDLEKWEDETAARDQQRAEMIAHRKAKRQQRNKAQLM